MCTNLRKGKKKYYSKLNPASIDDKQNITPKPLFSHKILWNENITLIHNDVIINEANIHKQFL